LSGGTWRDGVEKTYAFAVAVALHAAADDGAIDAGRGEGGGAAALVIQNHTYLLCYGPIPKPWPKYRTS
jgi:hypothetical protein